MRHGWRNKSLVVLTRTIRVGAIMGDGGFVGGKWMATMADGVSESPFPLCSSEKWGRRCLVFVPDMWIDLDSVH
ncbi:hypothetical protein U1Q18_008358 [Sarracenia purpurea var. burkii]